MQDDKLTKADKEAISQQIDEALEGKVSAEVNAEDIYTEIGNFIMYGSIQAGKKYKLTLEEIG